MLTTTPNDTNALTAEALTTRAAAAGEPPFLTERRLKALEQFQLTPVPDRKDEVWRRVELATINLDSIATASSAPASCALSGLANAARSRNVYWGAAGDAAKEIPDVLQQHWATQVFSPGHNGPSPAARKFHWLNQALWDGGYVLHVPKGVSVELPAKAEFRAAPSSPPLAGGAGGGVMPHNLVVLEEGASATLIESYASANGDPATWLPQTEIILGAGARLRYILLQRAGTEAIYIGAHGAQQGAESNLTFVSAHLGAKLEKAFMDVRMLAPKAQAQLVGLYCGTGAQRIHLDTFQHHVAPECTTTLLIKGALSDQARAVYRGMIRLEADAQKTDAYQQARALILSGDARVDSIPSLEILANDVKCSHGATVGEIDPTMLFYLMSRGLSQRIARKMILDGFFEEVMQRIALEAVTVPLREQIDAKLLGEPAGPAA